MPKKAHLALRSEKITQKSVNKRKLRFYVKTVIPSKGSSYVLCVVCDTYFLSRNFTPAHCTELELHRPELHSLL